MHLLYRKYDRILEINEVDVKQMSEEEMDRVLERVANFSVVKLVCNLLFLSYEIHVI